MIKEISPGLFHAQPSIGGRRYSVSAPTKAGVVKGIRKLHAVVEGQRLLNGARMVGNHIAHCQACRESYVTETLPLLLPETLSRIVGICEAEDALPNQRT